MSGRSPQLCYTLTLIAMQGHQENSKNKNNVVIIYCQYNDRSLPDNLLLTQAPIFVWFDGTIILTLCYIWWLCMVMNISVQYNGGLLPDIILSEPV